MPEYFDVHSHLNAPQFKDDVGETVERLRKTNTFTIVVGTDFEDSKLAVALAEKYKEVYASIGLHPVDNVAQGFEKEKFKELVKHPKVVAIGECGMDFFHADKDSDYERQKKIFLEQIDFALVYDKPLMIHARNSYLEILEILEPLKKEHKDKLRGNVHFFAGDIAVARRFFDMDLSVSFTGVITFTKDYDDVIKSAPLNRIMSETDSPYVAPVPYRGGRNEPSYVKEVVKRIAQIRGEDEDVIRTALVNNALSMIG